MFGFLSKGKMEIQIPRTNYAFNELIEGKVTMELKSPVKGKGVFIQFHATQKRSRTRRVSRGGKWVNENETYTHTVFSQSLTLDVEKEYPGNQLLEYPFQFKVPDLGRQPQQPSFGEGTLGNILNVVQQFAPQPSPVEWFLKAKLDTSGFDVNNDVRLYIS
jgi:hypothetical protein